MDSEVEPASNKSTEALQTEQDEIDIRCGYGAACKPSWLQRCADPKAYLVVITLFGIVQGFTVNGINNANIESYERRYHLSSTESSLVAISYDITAMVMVIFVGYFGGKGHQPRILGSGLICMGLGTLLMALAHLVAPPYQPASSTISLLCDLNSDVNQTQSCSVSDEEKHMKNYMALLLAGQVLNGFGGTCLFSLGVTYLDQSVPAKSSPLYIGVMTGGAIVGPALGYILGGMILTIYVNFPSPAPTCFYSSGLSTDSPAWVGAWWLGFLGSAIICFLLAACMLQFPKELPGTAAIRASKPSQAHNNGTETKVNVKGFGESWRDLPKAIRYLLKNAVFVLITLQSTIEALLVSASSTFLPKLIANQFSQPASWAAILTGLMAIPAGTLGQITGGLICKRFDLKVVGMLRLSLVSSILALVLLPMYLARCPDTQLAGVLAVYPRIPEQDFSTVNLSATCNSGCGCTTSVYDPVCADGIQYFSPCHAGCSQQPIKLENGFKIYQNCSCPVGQIPEQEVLNTTVAVAGICPLNCNLLYHVFVPVGVVQFFFTFLMSTPLTVSLLRVVPDSQRPLAVSVQTFILRLLGSVPGPIILGALIDGGCLLWQSTCGKTGSCWVYDTSGMAYRLIGVVVAFKSLSTIMNMLALKLYKPPDGMKSRNSYSLGSLSQSEEMGVKWTST